MNFRTEFNANKGVVCISTELVVEHFTGSDGDRLEEITGHEDNYEVANANLRSRVECRVGHHRLGPRGFSDWLNDSVGHGDDGNSDVRKQRVDQRPGLQVNFHKVDKQLHHVTWQTTVVEPEPEGIVSIIMHTLYTRVTPWLCPFASAHRCAQRDVFNIA